MVLSWVSFSLSYSCSCPSNWLLGCVYTLLVKNWSSHSNKGDATGNHHWKSSEDYPSLMVYHTALTRGTHIWGQVDVWDEVLDLPSPNLGKLYDHQSFWKGFSHSFPCDCLTAQILPLSSLMFPPGASSKSTSLYFSCTSISISDSDSQRPKPSVTLVSSGLREKVLQWEFWSWSTH